MCELREAFGGMKHARMHESGMLYHHLVRTVRGTFLLRPDANSVVEKLIAGVIARAQKRYSSVKLVADAWLSNHGHLLLEGAPEELPQFTGFIEREISRRLGAMIGWEGNMFQTYQSTALPTVESQLRAFEYVLAQSAKEHVVASPLKWPGAHCAKDLVSGFTRKGFWFDGTAYGRVLHKNLARKRNRTPPARKDFTSETEMQFARLPALAHLTDEEYRSHVRQLVREIEDAAVAERRHTNRKLIGRRRVLWTPRETRSALPCPPWFEKRRRMICWADRWAQETRAYLKRYWAFQRAFREASRRFLEGELDAPFPPGAFRPSIFAARSAVSV